MTGANARVKSEGENMNGVSPEIFRIFLSFISSLNLCFTIFIDHFKY